MAWLVWRAAKFVTRSGLHLVRRGAARGVQRVLHPEPPNVKPEMIDADFTLPPAPDADAAHPTLRDWRVRRAPEAGETKSARVTWGPKK